VGPTIEPLILPTGGLAPGAELTIGARPEHLSSAPDQVLQTSGIVELVERLGEASYAYVRRADDKRLVVEVRGRETPEVGARASFGAPLRDVHVFDGNGRRMATSA
jgi:ABC-type sugar transport system ATPase subunit